MIFRKKENRKGFTVTELTISIIFISTLLIMMVIVISRITGLYQKGLSINAINTTGKEIVDDIKRSIAEAPRENFTDLCSNKGVDCDAGEFDTLVYHQNYYDDPTSGKTYPTNGVFCTGKNSYVWNTGYALRYNIGKGNVDGYGDNFRLLKIPDSSRSLCIERREGGYFPASTSNITELLSDIDPRLVLYNLTIFDPALDKEENEHTTTYRPYYTGTFLLSTELKNDETTSVINSNSNGVFSCQTNNNVIESQISSNAYCAINKFNFAARAMGG